MIEWHDGEFGGSAEGAVGLGCVTPDALAYQIARDAVTDLIDFARPVTVRNDARVWHAEAEGILTLLDVAGIDA